MGTEIYLKAGSVMLDWSKNSRGSDHGVLFQEQDRTHVRSDQTDYADCEQHGIDTELYERALVRSLRSTLPRLELLGFTIDTAQAEYDQILADWGERYADEPATPAPIGFSEFIDFLTRHPVSALDDTFISGFGKDSRKQMQARFALDPAFERIPDTDGTNDGYSEASYFSSLIRILHPYSVLRLVAEVPQNLEVGLHPLP